MRYPWTPPLTTINSLPTEIHLQVLANLLPSYDALSSAAVLPGLHYTSLRNAALSSKLWRESAGELLHQVVVLDSERRVKGWEADPRRLLNRTRALVLATPTCLEVRYVLKKLENARLEFLSLDWAGAPLSLEVFSGHSFRDLQYLILNAALINSTFLPIPTAFPFHLTHLKLHTADLPTGFLSALFGNSLRPLISLDLSDFMNLNGVRNDEVLLSLRTKVYPLCGPGLQYLTLPYWADPSEVVRQCKSLKFLEVATLGLGAAEELPPELEVLKVTSQPVDVEVLWQIVTQQPKLRQLNISAWFSPTSTTWDVEWEHKRSIIELCDAEEIDFTIKRDQDEIDEILRNKSFLEGDNRVTSAVEFQEEQQHSDPHAPYSPFASTSKAVFPPLSPRPPTTTTSSKPFNLPSAFVRATPPHMEAPNPQPQQFRQPGESTNPLAVVELPTTERALYHFLWHHRKTTRTTESAVTIATIHGHHTLRSIVSSRTYGQVLYLALSRSNWALVRSILAEMRDRQIAWDEWICRHLLSAYLKRGDAVRVEGVLREMRKGGLKEPLAYINWRRDLGDQAKGNGDAWKVWKERLKTAPREAERPTKVVRRPSRGRFSRATGTESSYKTFDDTEAKMKRTATYVPPDVGCLSNFDVTALVESLVQDQRGSQALEAAETWLDENRPLPPDPVPPPLALQPRYQSYGVSTHEHHIRTYEATAVVLLNIVLKILFTKDLYSPHTKTFLEYFVSTHSVSPERPLTPNLVTLYELIAPLPTVKMRPTNTFTQSWNFRRASNLVNWFGARFGIAAPGKPVLRFALVPSDTLDTVLEKEPSKLAVCHVKPKVAWCLLRLANIEVEKERMGDPRVRLWWNGISKVGAEWDSASMKREVLRAVQLGVLPKEALGRIAVDGDAGKGAQ
ncbi:hypothetical protein P7C70_g269, partial [Phenoliferia sp. Uapishka_3]